MSSSRNEPLLLPVIMGPTASGKSALALELAQRLSGEIISADSMQIYRGLDIGTAKPSQEERRLVPHHLVDYIEFTEKYDVFRFTADAERLAGDIRGRNRLPVIAGGTGLYLRAFLYGLDPLPASPELRRELDKAYDNDVRFPELQSLMEREDPADFARVGKHRRKLIRAREVFLLSGSPMTVLQERWKKSPPRADARSFVLVWDNAALRARIAARCAQMLDSGWIEEAEHFLKQGLHDSPTAWQVLGYREIAACLAGKLKRGELQEKITTATWQFARRQNTWFRTQHPEAGRMQMPDPEIARKIEAEISGGNV